MKGRARGARARRAGANDRADVLEDILDRAPGAMSYWSPTATLRLANAAFYRMVGGDETWVGRPADEVFGEDGPAITTGIETTGRGEAQRLSTRAWFVQILPRLVDGEVVGCHAFLEEHGPERGASRLKSEFLANMSHELRTPLNAIIGFSSLLQTGKAGPLTDRQREFVGDVLASSNHLLQLINDVLDLAKIEAGKHELELEETSIEALVAQVGAVARALAVGARIDLSFEIDRALAMVVVDPRATKQILYNFLSNAIKFTPRGGRVVVRARTEDEASFRIEVEDDGIGIAEDDLPRLFVEFEQLDAGTTKRYAGTGLGLALSKKLAEAQGGSVGVTSEKGRGSRFFVVLPRAVIGSSPTKGERVHAGRDALRKRRTTGAG